MKQKIVAVVVMLLFSTCLVAQAQKIEVAGTAAVAVSPDGKGILTCAEGGVTCIPPGPTPSPTSSLPIGAGFSWQASFAYRLANFRAAALYVELPVSGSPTRSTGGIGEFTSVFFTPSAHFKFLPDAGISPFASLGAGVAHFSNTLGGSSDNTGAFQIGGGVDFRTRMRALGIRIEVRDFITGRPAIGAFADFSSGHLQNIFAGGGFVLKF